MDATTTLGGTELLSFAVSLIVVVAVIVVLGWLYRRSRNFGSANTDAINVVATRMLGAKERLMLVEVADKQLLVGMTASQVQTLHVFDSPVVELPATAEVAGFAGRLRSALQEMRR
jgi:flagellar protein FliO/FliZ